MVWVGGGKRIATKQLLLGSADVDAAHAPEDELDREAGARFAIADGDPEAVSHDDAFTTLLEDVAVLAEQDLPEAEPSDEASHRPPTQRCTFR